MRRHRRYLTALALAGVVSVYGLLGVALQHADVGQRCTLSERAPQGAKEYDVEYSRLLVRWTCAATTGAADEVRWTMWLWSD